MKDILQRNIAKHNREKEVIVIVLIFLLERPKAMNQ